MEHRDVQQALFARWRVEAYLDGQRVNVVGGLPARTLSARRGRGTCTLPITGLPSSGKKTATVDLILNDIHTVRFFTGFTAERSATYASFSRSANLTDILNLDRAVPTAITWNNTAWSTALTAILAAGGLADVPVELDFDPGTTFRLGPVYPIIIPKTETLSSVFQELLDFAGAAAYVSPNGYIRIVDGSAVPMSTSAIIYAHGANLSAGEFGIIDAGLSIEGDESVISVFTATGPKTPAGAQPDGTFTATFSGKPESRQYRFAQSDTVCQAIASRELSRRARERTNLWFTAPLNPLLLPSATLLFRCTALGFPTNTPAYVAEVTTNDDASMRVALVTGPSLVDGYSTSIAPPVVDWSMTVESQSITLAGVPVTGYLVQCKDQSHDKAGYEITARAWTATGTGASPTSGSAPELIFLFTSLEGASITLHVTSASGEEAERTRAPQASAVEVFTRTVSVAASDGWHVLIRTGWQSFTTAGACTAVPPINESGPLWAGFSSGALYQSLTALQTAPTLITTFSSGIGCLWVNEGTVTDILVGHGTALSRSQDGGTTWSLLHTFGASVNECQNSPTNPSEIRVCAGALELISYDGGATWGTLITGAIGATARSIASAPWGHAVGFTGVASVADALRFEEGHTVVWTAVEEASRPASGLAAVTALLSEQGFVAAEDGDLVRDGTLPALILQADAGGSNLYKLLWNGAAFDATLLPATTAAGPGKLINQANAYPIDSTSAVQIGYGPLAAPATVVGAFYRLPYNQTGAADKLWSYRNGVWTGIALPEAGRSDWKRVVVNPANPLDILLWRWGPPGSPAYSAVPNRLWYSADGGANWVSIFQDLSMRGDMTPPMIDFSGQGNGDWIGTQHSYPDGVDRLLRGTRATYTTVTPSQSTYALDRFPAHYGNESDVILQTIDSGAWPWLDGTNTLHAPASGGNAFSHLDRANGTRQAAASGCAEPTEVFVTLDYRSAAWTAIPSSFARWAAAVGTSLICGGRHGLGDYGNAYGVQEVFDAWTAPAIGVPTLLVTLPIGHVRSDRTTQTVAAASILYASQSAYSLRTALRDATGEWTIIEPPTGVTTFVDWVEVVAQ